MSCEYYYSLIKENKKRYENTKCKLNKQLNVFLKDLYMKCVNQVVGIVNNKRLTNKSRSELYILDISDVLENEWEPTKLVNKIIKNLYPGIWDKMEIMDMISTRGDDYEYRGGSVYFMDVFDNEKVLIKKETRYSDYGYPPLKFIKKMGAEYFSNVPWHQNVEEYNEWVNEPWGTTPCVIHRELKDLPLFYQKHFIEEKLGKEWMNKNLK